MDEGSAFQGLDRAFDAAMARVVGRSTEVAVLFSGGVDSSLVAAAAGRCTRTTLHTVGLPGAPDLVSARAAAEELGLPYVEHEIQDDDVAAVLGRFRLAGEPEPRRSVLASLASALGIPGPELRLAGQGADELFGGYAHFRGLTTAAADARRREDWALLRAQDWPASEEIARRLGRSIRSPFLDPAFSDLAVAIPLEPVAEAAPTKPFLRRWAAHRGLPRSVVERPKKAIQYGSGIAAVVRRAGRI